MVGQNVYTTEEIKFLLQRFIEGKDGSQIAEEYHDRFEKVLTPNQLRYVRNKYGKDPKYNTAMINTNMGGKKRQRSDDDDDEADDQIPSSSPDPKPKKQRRDSSSRSQPAAKKSAETDKPSPKIDKVNWNATQSDQHQPQAQHRFQSQTQGRTTIPLQLPLATYPQFPASEIAVDIAQNLIPPAAASANSIISHPQPSCLIPSDYRQIQTPWDSDDQSLGNFANFGSLGNLPTMQPSPATPSVVLTPQTSQHRSLINSAPRIVQPHFPLASNYQTVVSPQPVYHPQQRLSAQPMPQYLMNQQPIDGLPPMNQLSPLNLPLPATPYYNTNLQASPQPEIQSPQALVASSAQTLVSLNQNWGSYMSPGLCNVPQQQGPDIALSYFQPIPETSAVEAKAAVVSSNGNDSSPRVVLPPVAMKSAAITTEITTPAAPYVVSNQVSRPSEARKEGREVSLTAEFEPRRHPLIDDGEADPTVEPDHVRDMMTALFPRLEQSHGIEDLLPSETIDPKLLAEMYTISVPEQDTAAPPEEEHETTAFAESGEAT